jgi:hypothetical protein
MAFPESDSEGQAWVATFRAGLGATALPGSPDDFGKLNAEDTEKWAKVVKFAGPACNAKLTARQVSLNNFVRAWRATSPCFLVAFILMEGSCHGRSPLKTKRA